MSHSADLIRRHNVIASVDRQLYGTPFVAASLDRARAVDLLRAAIELRDENEVLRATCDRLALALRSVAAINPDQYNGVEDQLDEVEAVLSVVQKIASEALASLPEPPK